MENKIKELQELIEQKSSLIVVENENSEDRSLERIMLVGNEKPLIRNSDILSVYYNSKFANKNIEKSILEAAGKKGTAVHDAIEFFLTTGLNSVDQEYYDYMEEFLEWYKEQETKTIFMEKRIWNPNNLTSLKPDWYRYDVKRNKFILSDFKTNTNPDVKPWSAQLWNYKNALISHGFPVDEIEIIHIRRFKKMMEFQVYKIDEFLEKEGQKLFESCYNVIKAINGDIC